MDESTRLNLEAAMSIYSPSKLIDYIDRHFVPKASIQKAKVDFDPSFIPILNRILEAVCEWYGLSLEEIKSGIRRPEISFPRAMYVYIAMKLFPGAQYRMVAAPIKKNPGIIKQSIGRVQRSLKDHPHANMVINDVINKIQSEFNI